MHVLQDFLTAFFSFKAYVMLPIIIWVIALVVRVPFKRALISTLELSVGFAGVFIAFNFFVSNISPAVQQLSQARGLNFPVLDVGWLPLAAITWASPLAAISIPLVLLLNGAMLATGLTRTIYIDIWNYWHFAFLGALVMNVSGSLLLGLSATLLIAVYCFKLTEWTAPDVEREMGLKGISASPVSVNGIVPYTACVDWLLDRIPGIKNISYNPERASRSQAAHQPPGDGALQADQGSLLDLLGEPMVIGFLMGLALALAAGYGTRETLELSVHIAAVMFLLPKSAGLIGEAMIPVTTALRQQVERRFPHRKNLVVALDTGFLMHHKSVVVTGLLLMALAIGIALVLPGNQVLPLGDLPNLISVMSLSVLMFRGNVFRAVLAGIPVIVSFLLISSHMAPLFTDLARKTPSFNSEGLGLITAFTDGGHQMRFLVFSIYQGQSWAWAALPVVLAAMLFTRRRYQSLAKPQPPIPS
jgi:PTS system galactitol-specific IIC component